MNLASYSEVVLVHSSDLHLGADSGAVPLSHSLSVLRAVLAAAEAVQADLLLLAGDTFDNNRQSSRLLACIAQTLSGYPRPVVILPGNHDPLTPDSVYRHTALAAIRNLYVLGLTVSEAVVFPDLQVEVWGRAHLDYGDMSPLRTPRTRSTRWQIVAAHGHYVEGPDKPDQRLGSWLMRPRDLLATGADYIALGHWIHAKRVGGRQINAHYSGSPEEGGTVNIVRLQRDGTVAVNPLPVHISGIKK